MNTPAAPAAADSPPPGPPPPLVLVHGLWDTPRLFRRLQRQLGERRDPLLIPQLPHRFGLTPIETLAELLGGHIEAAFGRTTAVDVLGFSMGGVIARTWVQLEGGHRRTRRLTTVASPHRGTLAALPWPGRWLPGLADMKPGSSLLRRLDAQPECLRAVECCSFYCPTDLTVFPGWQAVLPFGPRQPLPVFWHNRLMAEPGSLDPVARELLRP
ncbi:MAG: esterase/lipase family protein [Cyanobium sp.]